MVKSVTLFAAAITFVGLGHFAHAETITFDQNTRLYRPGPAKADAVEAHIQRLEKDGKDELAKRVREMVQLPQAVWLEQGSPEEVEAQAKAVMERATKQDAVPVLVAYNIPFRDCAQYSAGGATSVEEYKAWIDGVARGIGSAKAMVILEPDGVGIIPWYTDIDGNMEWCQPEEADAKTAAQERFDMLGYAVNKLKAGEGTRVYMDGTHPAWLPPGKLVHRLMKGGVEKADGVFLNASNYVSVDKNVKFGEWIVRCLAIGQSGGDIASCASQYHPADAGDFSTWTKTDEWYAEHTPKDAKLKNFVVDTSRNGNGAWQPGTEYPDAQTWCNPPGRSLGPHATAIYENELLDAFLWIKIPGESDGECGRGLKDKDGVDPEWGRVDPAAGQWFEEQAEELVSGGRRAN